MKHKLLTASILFLSIYAFFSCGKGESSLEAGPGSAGKKAAGAEVKFYSFNEGLALAKKEKKAIIVDFYADWCRWCKVMDEQVFSDKEVADLLNKNYIVIRIYTDRPDSEKIVFKNQKLSSQEFAGYVGVQGLPTLIFMESSGEPITKIPGFVNKDVFIPLLKYVNDGCHKQSVSFQDFMDGKKNCK
jgi:thioredoxin-related protein